MHRLIPKEIAYDEPCIRCVMPSKMKKGIIRNDAFLPLEHGTGASVLRLNYTTIDFCIEYGMSLDKEKHRLGALLKFSQREVDKINEWAQSDASKIKNEETGTESVNGTCAHLIYSPMDGKDYVDPEKDYYTDSCISAPMHADLEFNEPLERGFVRIRMRQYNNQLIKLCKKAFMNEGNNELGDWTM